MADHMTAGQLRAELSALNEFLGVVSGYAKIDDERVRLARGRMTSLAARLSGMAAVPAGYKLVPLTPTPEMQRAYFNSIDKHMDRVQTSPCFGRHDNHRIAYAQMLAAAPEPPHAHV